MAAARRRLGAHAQMAGAASGLSARIIPRGAGIDDLFLIEAIRSLS